MSPVDKDWQRLQTVFHGALERGGSEQQSYLDRECAGDPELRARVKELLATAESGTGAIEDAIEEAAANTVRVTDLSGERVGAYRLTREIGRGGMGAVYLAERAEGGFDQQVAIKLVGAGHLNPRILERFLAERRILAGLEHPNIARLLDGGQTADGLPYFVLELVDGVPIDRFCDRNRLTTRERLELFRQVCSAVEFAHRRLIVHRDLKPSNILVTPDGTPKLLDFGIAKLIEPDSEDPAATGRAERVLTPEYASPEQIRGEPISTATDVYALGLLLYELLTGRKAHSLPSSVPSDVERVICDESPERPSEAVSGSAEIGEARALSAAALGRLLRGDLDNLVLMALRKEPERRYASVEQLSDDVRRYLEGRPILAHADSFGYRAAKFVRRNAIPVAAALLVFGALVAATIVSSLGLARARAAETAAREEAATSETIATFLEDLFAVSDPGEARGASVTAREILERGVERIETELGDQPGVQSRLMTRMGVTYSRLGLEADAIELFESARERSSEALGPSHPNTILAIGSLGAALLGTGEFQPAETHLRTAYQRSRDGYGEEHADTLKFLNNLALSLWRQGRLAETVDLFGRLVDTNRRVFGDRGFRTIVSISNLAAVYGSAGRLSDSVVLAEEALAGLIQLHGEDHPHSLDAMHNLGVGLDRMGLHERAGPRLLRALELKKKVLGEEHPETLRSLGALVVHYTRTDRLDEAEELAARVHQTAVRVLGEEHPSTLWYLRDLGRVHHRQGRVEEAERQLRAAWKGRTRALGPDHPSTLESLRNLAAMLADSGRLEEAEEALRQVLAGLETRRKELHPKTLEVTSELGEVIADRGRLSEARELLSATAGEAREQFPEESILVVRVLARLGRCHRLSELHDQATTELEDALEAASRIDDRHRREPLEELILVSEARADLDSATEYRRALDTI